MSNSYSDWFQRAHPGLTHPQRCNVAGPPSPFSQFQCYNGSTKNNFFICQIGQSGRLPGRSGSEVLASRLCVCGGRAPIPTSACPASLSRQLGWAKSPPWMTPGPLEHFQSSAVSSQGRAARAKGLAAGHLHGHLHRQESLPGSGELTPKSGSAKRR